MEHTLVAVFDKESEAQDALNDLVAEGFSHSDMYINAAQQGSMGQTSSAGTTGTAVGQESIGERIASFFSELFGGEHTARADTYSQAIERGGYVLTLTARDDEQVERATEILNRHNAVDMEEREAQWQSSDQTSAAGLAPGAAAPAASTQTAALETGTVPGAGVKQTDTGARPQRESEAIPVVEEELQVGKRMVQRGGVRVVPRVTEKPVQETVQLHDERVTVERRPVDQPASAADTEGWKDRTVEVREMIEEPVVGKTARVVEEVVVGKESRDRTATIQDTVRRTDVEVEQLGAQTAHSATSGTATDDTEFRNHWQSSYAQAGGRYEDYAPAYQYGSTLGTDQRYRGQQWEAIEPQVRADWESTHAGNPWEKMSDAIRTGWEKVTR